MKIRTFIKRLNATELGRGATNDTYIAIPNEADLSTMFINNVAITVKDKDTGRLFAPPLSKIKYTQTGQNNQERISGLGEYFRFKQANVGDEIVLEKQESSSGQVDYYIDLIHRDVIVMQKSKTYIEIIRRGVIDQYREDED